MEILQLLSVNEIVAQLICFFAVFFLLRIFLWKNFLKILDDRKSRIKDELQNIDSAKAEVASLKNDFAAKLHSIDQIAAARYEATLKGGREAADEIKDRARQEAQQIVSEAKAEIERTVIKTKAELRKEVVDLTLLATQKLIEEKLTTDDDRRLVSNFIDQLEKKDD